MIQIENLDFWYTKKKPLFSKLNLRMTPGKIYGLLGKNGTGKSTLLKLLVGGLFPKQGTVRVGEYQAKNRQPEMLEDLYFLPEDMTHSAISIQAYENAYSGFYPKFDHQKFLELLSLFEVQLDSKLSDLSFGQRKKVMISFGLATNTKYLLMDEPTNGLDIPSKSQFRKALLRGFIEDQIVIISTHQIRDLNQLIETVIILDNGQVIFNQDVLDIEEQLLFTKSISEEALPELIYSEGIAGGYVHLQPNSTGEPSEVELEVLFNAVIANPNISQQYLNR